MTTERRWEGGITSGPPLPTPPSAVGVIIVTDFRDLWSFA